jgi:mono/diheme cytochrome c family protein
MRPSRSVAAIAVALLAACSTHARADGTIRPPAEGYLLHCSGCHGRDGRGTPGVTPSLHDLGSLLGQPGGREYLARVPGVAQAPVGDEELAWLLNWVLDTYSSGALESRYTAAEVGALRSRPIRDTVAARARLTAPPH